MKKQICRSDFYSTCGLLFLTKRSLLRSSVSPTKQYPSGIAVWQCPIPPNMQALNAMHRGTTRYLKCPECNKRTWCKKVLKK